MKQMGKIVTDADGFFSEFLIFFHWAKGFAGLDHTYGDPRRRKSNSISFWPS